MTVFFLGSSITRGELTGGVSFVERFRDITGASVQKQAVSGTTLAVIGDGNSYVERLENFDFSDSPDAVVVQLSTNDFSRGVPLGAIPSGAANYNAESNKKTILGAIGYIVSRAMELSPDACVCFYSCPMTKNYAKYAEYGGFVRDFAAKYAKELGVELIDFYAEEYSADCLGADGFHPNEKGYRKMAGTLVEYFTKL